MVKISRRRVTVPEQTVREKHGRFNEQVQQTPVGTAMQGSYQRESLSNSSLASDVLNIGQHRHKHLTPKSNRARKFRLEPAADVTALAYSGSTCR